MLISYGTTRSNRFGIQLTNLNITVLVLQRPTSDLKQSHSHPWPNLGQFDALITSHDKDMMAHLDTILDILERDYPTAYLPGPFSRRKKMFQDLRDPFSQPTLEPVEDEMGITLRDRPACRPRDIMTQHDVMQRERGRRSMGKMGDGQRRRRPPVFMQENDIREPRRHGRGHQVGQHHVAPVQTDGRWKQQADFFRKRRQPRRRVARCRHQHPRIHHPAQLRVLVVDLELFLNRPIRSRLVVPVIPPQLCVVGDLGRQWLAACQRRFQLCPLLGDLRIFESECASVEIVSSLASMSSLVNGLAEKIFTKTEGAD